MGLEQGDVVVLLLAVLADLAAREGVGALVIARVLAAAVVLGGIPVLVAGEVEVHKADLAIPWRLIAEFREAAEVAVAVQVLQILL
jgi:hypothetical protein